MQRRLIDNQYKEVEDLLLDLNINQNIPYKSSGKKSFNKRLTNTNFKE